MSELLYSTAREKSHRWQLMVSASAMALCGLGFTAGQASAVDEANKPVVWIELGGQFAAQKSERETYLPPFMLTQPRPPVDVANPNLIEKPNPSSWDGTAKISFEPAGTDWIFSAALRFGRSSQRQSSNHQTSNPTSHIFGILYTAYQNLQGRSSESHTVLDFQAGRDVGLGRFGLSGISTLSFGVRYAQFSSRNNVTIRSKPENTNYNYHKFYASFAGDRKFTGVGPSLSWNASAEILGKQYEENLTFDWGVNAAVLFGRQRMNGSHTTKDVYQSSNNLYGPPAFTVYRHSVPLARSKSVTVPNLGGFAGLSWHYLNAKVSVGYRADFFLGAMDGGIDSRKPENVGFYGPFATISVGLGG